MLNHTHIFFSWSQITSTDDYHLYISDNVNFTNSDTIITQTNSYLSEDILNWGGSYFWKVCDGNNELCYDYKSFSISYLPLYYPDNVNVITYNEVNSLNGLNCFKVWFVRLG